MLINTKQMPNNIRYYVHGIFNSTNVIIECKSGSNRKNEVSDSGRLELDRILPNGLVFPANYGFIPSTIGKDGDPLDVFVIGGSENVQYNNSILVDIVGYIPFFEDINGATVDDVKLLAVPFGSAGYKFRSVAVTHIVADIEQFLRVYKDANQTVGEPVLIGTGSDRGEVDEEIQVQLTEGIARYTDEVEAFLRREDRRVSQESQE